LESYPTPETGFDIGAHRPPDGLRESAKSEAVTLQIVRIDRVGDVNAFEKLDGDTLNAIATDPLLSSARVLEGLFFEAAVVTEADRDSRFYQAAMRRAHPKKHCHSVDAPSKQSVTTIMGIYRSTGVRHVGIVDFDILRKPEELENALRAIELDEPQIQQAMAARGVVAASAGTERTSEALAKKRAVLEELSTHFEELESTASGAETTNTISLKTLNRLFSKGANLGDRWTNLKKLGRNALNADGRASFDELSQLARARGLFILPAGELESILSDCGVPHQGDKRVWFEHAMKLLPKLTVDNSDQVWVFIKDIVEHLTAKQPAAGASIQQTRH